MYHPLRDSVGILFPQGPSLYEEPARPLDLPVWASEIKRVNDGIVTDLTKLFQRGDTPLIRVLKGGRLLGGRYLGSLREA